MLCLVRHKDFSERQSLAVVLGWHAEFERALEPHLRHSPEPASAQTAGVPATDAEQVQLEACPRVAICGGRQHQPIAEFRPGLRRACNVRFNIAFVIDAMLQCTATEQGLLDMLLCSKKNFSGVFDVNNSLYLYTVEYYPQFLAKNIHLARFPLPLVEFVDCGCLSTLSFCWPGLVAAGSHS